MRIFCGFVVLALIVVSVSCQKELNFENGANPANPTTPQDDSVTLVKTIKTINYDAVDAFYWQTQENYSYDKVSNKTTVTHIDSSAHVAGEVENYTEVFQYDAQNRLTQFTSTSKYEPVTKIDFSYSSSGDILKAMVTDQKLGKTIDCNFTSVTQNSQKTITEYDTSGVFGNGDSRPEITKTVFDADNRLVRQSVYNTYYRQTGGWYKDSSEVNLFYDNNNNVYKSKGYSAYYSSPPNFLTSVLSNDSTVYSRSGTNTVLFNSFITVYKNMYWFSVSGSSGFGNAMLNSGNILTYFGSPVSTAEYWYFELKDPAASAHGQGTFQNIFDADGLLTKSIYPKNFANKYGGKAEAWYTYTKIKK